MWRALILTVTLLIPELSYAQANIADGELKGESFVDFQFENLKGQKIDSDIFRKGKILVMKMGNLSCPMCTSLLSKLGKLEKQYRSHPIKFLDISFEGDAEALKKHSLELGSEIETLMDPQGLLASYYKIQGIPVTIIASKEAESTILFHQVGDMDEEYLKKVIDKFLTK
tara:strand:- start:4707 stop:5216 length:510 start_codon:yes stop_codon:yes gene_type:complete